MASSRILNIAATTLDKMAGTFGQAVIDANPLLKYMEHKGGKVVLDGGSKYYRPVAFAKSAGSFYTPTSKTTTVAGSVNTDQFMAGEFVWEYLYTDFVITGDEMISNMGTAQMVSLIKAKAQIAKLTLSDMLRENLFTHGSNSASSFVGLDTVMTDDGHDGAGVVGGIAYNASGVTAGDWSNQNSDGKADYSDMSSKMLSMWLTLQGKGARPAVIATHPNVYAYYEGTLGVAKIQFTDTKMLDMGFMNATYKGTPILIDEKAVDASSDEVMYFIDTRHMGFFVHKDRNVKVGKMKDSEVMLDAKYSRIMWAGNLWCDNRKYQGVITWSES